MDRESKKHDLNTGEDEEIEFCVERGETFDTEKAKGLVVLCAGCSACVTVTALAIMQGYSVMKGGPGIGIDLNHILLAYLAGMAMVYKWAFPSKEK